MSDLNTSTSPAKKRPKPKHRRKADVRPPIPLEGFGIDPLDGFVWGIAQIAAIISSTTRKTYYLAEQGLIDCDKVGNRWRSTPRRTPSSRSARRRGSDAP